MKTEIKILFAAIIFVVSSCGIWSDFTTYFNTYYNAKDLFEVAQTKIKEGTKKQSLFEFREEQTPAAARKDLDGVIEKCSKILEIGQESSYINEALFMIGRAYYFQGNFTKALRKFRELEAQPDTDFKLENQLYISKSLLQLRQFDAGLENLEQVKTQAEAEENEEILFEATLTEIRYMVYREDYSSAIDLAKKLLEISDDDALNSKISFELANLYLKTEDFENAAVTFKSVNDYEPDFDLEFQSQLEYAKVLRELNKTDESIEVLESLNDEDKFKDKTDMIDLEIAEAHYKDGDIDKALDYFIDIDTSYGKSPSSGIAAYRRAQIIEKDFVDFDSAKVLYDKINTSTAPQEIKANSREKSQLLRKYGDYRYSLEKFERQLSYMRDSSVYIADSIAYFGYYDRKDSLKALMEEMKQLEGKNFDSTKYVMKNPPPFRAQPVIPKIGIDSMRTQIAKNIYELGNLFFTDLDAADSVYTAYRKILEKYPYTSYQAKTMYALGSYYLTIDQKEKADSLFLEIYTKYESDPIVNAAAQRLGKEQVSLNRDEAGDKYKQAEDILLSDKYDEAIAALFSIAKNYPESQFAAKSLYTIGFVLENNLNMPDSAASIYDTLDTKYKRTEYASAVRTKLGFYNSKQKAIRDSLALIQKAIRDSIKADSLASIKTDSVKVPVEKISPQVKPAADSSGSVVPDSTDVMKVEVPEVSPSVSDSTKTKIENIVPKRNTAIKPKPVLPDTTRKK